MLPEATTEDKDSAGTCLICGEPDGLRHIFCECGGGNMEAIREEANKKLTSEIGKKRNTWTTSQLRIAYSIRDWVWEKNKSEGWRLWVCRYDKEMRRELLRKLRIENTITTKKAKEIGVVILGIGKWMVEEAP